jgi:hypothetical protein
LEGNLAAGVAAAAEEVDLGARQRERGLVDELGKIRVKGETALLAAARAKASETARIAFAPYRDLSGVPSSSTSASSMYCCLAKERPASASLSSPSIAATASRQPKPP